MDVVTDVHIAISIFYGEGWLLKLAVPLTSKPISLANLVFNIIPKAIATRISPYSLKLISPNQIAFIQLQGRIVLRVLKKIGFAKFLQLHLRLLSLVGHG